MPAMELGQHVWAFVRGRLIEPRRHRQSQRFWELNQSGRLVSSMVKNRGYVSNWTILMMGRKSAMTMRSEEHTSELQSHSDLVCRLLLEKKKNHVIDFNGSGLQARSRNVEGIKTVFVV